MKPELTDEQKSLLEHVQQRFEEADELHARYRQRWDGFWAQYHSYTDFKASWASAAARERDLVLHDGKRQWGAALYIPYTYSTIETLLPRMLSHRPRMLWLPRDREAAANTENMRWLLDQQQERMDYELRLQTTAKTGLILGLGVSKLDWVREERPGKRLVRPTVPTADGPAWVEQERTLIVWDDPWVENVDPYDFLWDPYGHDMRSASYVIHRTWRSTRYVLDKLRSGEWDLLADGRQLEAADLEGSGGKQRWEELQAGRRRAEGYGASTSRGRTVHEVWEYHGGGEVIVVVDRWLPVRRIPNPAWHGEFPFSVYRPTEIPGRMVGKGEPEPIADLQAEMNTLRSQRRDNATLKLQQGFFFDEGALDPHDVEFGPGMMVPVRPNGTMRDAIVPMQVGDIPHSGYAEEDRLRGDIERVTGLSDETLGATSSSETATGAQLMQAAASSRIQVKTRRLELELIKRQARQMVLLNQQRIIGNRTIRVPSPPSPGQPDRTWAHRVVGPEELYGDWDIEPLGGATAPENVPQDRSDAQMLLALFGQHPGVDKRRILLRALEKMGLSHPEMYLVPDEYIPVEALELIHQGLVEQGAPVEETRAFIEEAVQAARELRDEPPRGPVPPPADEEMQR